MRLRPATPLAALALLALVAMPFLVHGTYYRFLGIIVFIYGIVAVGLNILAGYAGQFSLGHAALMAVGAYTTVALRKALGLDLLPCIAAAAAVGALVGLGTGYLTLRLRGVYFAIATLSLAVLLHTVVVNWSYVGGSRGAYVVRPPSAEPFVSYGEYLFVVMLVNLKRPPEAHHDPHRQTRLGFILAASIFLELGAIAVYSSTRPPLAASAGAAALSVPVTGNTEEVGWLLYTNYLIPFEVASMLLLVAMIGAIVLAKREL